MTHQSISGCDSVVLYFPICLSDQSTMGHPISTSNGSTRCINDVSMAVISEKRDEWYAGVFPKSNSGSPAIQPSAFPFPLSSLTTPDNVSSYGVLPLPIVVAGHHDMRICNQGNQHLHIPFKVKAAVLLIIT